MVERIVRGLVDRPDCIELLETEEGQALELRVAKEDLGKVIGKRGKTVQSMRTLLEAAGAKTGRKMTLNVVE